MKKFISILLAVLMLFSCFSINVFAETTDAPEDVTEKLLYLGDVQGYGLYFDPSALGDPAIHEKWMGNYFFFAPAWYNGADYRLYVIKGENIYPLEDAYDQGLITDIETVYNLIHGNEAVTGISVNLYSDDVKLFYEQGFYGIRWVETLGTFGNYQLCYAGSNSDSTDKVTDVPVGNYLFRTTAEGRDILLYLREGDKVVTLVSAYEKGLITDDDMDVIYGILFNDENKDRQYRWTVEKMDENTRRLYAFTEQGIKVTWVEKLGSVGEYELCYGSSDSVVERENTNFIGKYNFQTTTQFYPEYTGLFLRKQEIVYTLVDAYRQGLITDADMDTVYGVLYNEDNKSRGYNWTVEIMDEVKTIFTKYLISKNIDTTSLTYYNLGTVGEKVLCYGGRYRGFGKFEYTIGNYAFSGERKYSNSDVGMYIVNGDSVYPLEDAYQQGIITDADMDSVYKIIKSESNSELIAKEKITVEKTKPTPKVSVKIKKSKIKAGKTTSIKVKNAGEEKITFISKNKDIAKVSKNGVVTGLKKGNATVIVKVGDKTFKCKVKVTTTPKLTKGGKKVKEVKVRKNGTVKVRIEGRVKSIKNQYYNTKKARVISGKNASVLKIKGIKSGKSTIKIQVNKTKILKLKIKVST